MISEHGFVLFHFVFNKMLICGFQIMHDGHTKSWPNQISSYSKIHERRLVSNSQPIQSQQNPTSESRTESVSKQLTDYPSLPLLSFAERSVNVRQK